MLGLKNPRDEDWVTFVDAPIGTVLERNERRVGFNKFRIQSFIQDKNDPADANKAQVFYQLSCAFYNDPKYPFNDFNILRHKEVWIKHLKNYMNLTEVEYYATTTSVLPKLFYHILYQYHMIIENVHFISEDSKVKVQKIHDLEMPSSYFYELRDLINSL